VFVSAIAHDKGNAPVGMSGYNRSQETRTKNDGGDYTHVPSPRIIIVLHLYPLCNRTTIGDILKRGRTSSTGSIAAT
jgi:hypothetical protein